LFLPRLSYVFALAAAAFLAGCPKTSSEFSAGQKAENLQDYDTALAHYEHALRDQPTNTEYKLRTMHVRMEDAQFHVEQGQKAFDKGDLQQALAEFQRAQAVDSSNSAADQGISKTMQAIAAKNAPRLSSNAADEAATDADLLVAPPELKLLSRDPINLKMTNDTRVIYETIAKLAGLSVIFDPDVTPRRIPVELPNVTLEQALDIVSLATRNFWKPLTASVIYVAPDNPQKRRDVEDEEVRTFYLSNTITAQDLTEIITGLRQLLDLRRVQQVNAQNAIIIRDTPDKLALAAKIIKDADKAKPEVLIHVQVLTANRNRLRDLGILPGQTASLIFNPTCAVQPTSSNCSTTSSSSSTSTTTAAPSVALNELKNLSTADYSLTLPGLTANAILTDNNTKIIQDPEVRIADGEKATLKIGEKVPIATGSFQAGVGVSTTSVSPLVNTQFTYQDVGVNITVTPRVHPGGDVSMKLTVEISALDGSENIGGITQPIISSQSIDHDVRLKDGEVSVLGGLIQRTETNNQNGIPGISQIPGLKDIIGDNNTSVQESELLIVLTPHIIRFPSIEKDNLATIAAGTDTNPRVFHDGETPLPSVAGAPVTPPAPAVASTAPAGRPNPPAMVQPGAAAQLRFEPANVNMKVGDTQTIGLSVNGVNDLYSLPLMIKYNPALVHVQEIRDGGFLSGGSQAIAIVQRIDDQNGQAIVSATRQPNTPGVNGSGTLLGIVVKAIAPGPAAIQILQVNARNSQQQPIPLVAGEATIQVQ
jgi:general secretion pathway protein D